MSTDKLTALLLNNEARRNFVATQDQSAPLFGLLNLPSVEANLANGWAESVAMLVAEEGKEEAVQGVVKAMEDKDGMHSSRKKEEDARSGLPSLQAQPK